MIRFTTKQERFSVPEEEGSSSGKKEILERARTAPKTKWIEKPMSGGGECSSCGANVPFGNFCDNCAATFLTDEQIKNGEVNEE
jgi:hypothetical protein